MKNMKNTHLILIAAAILLTISLPFAAFGQTGATTTPSTTPVTAPIFASTAPISDAAGHKKAETKKDNLGQAMKKINMGKIDIKKVKHDAKKEIKKEAKIVKKTIKKDEKKLEKKSIKKTKKTVKAVTPAQ